MHWGLQHHAGISKGGHGASRIHALQCSVQYPDSQEVMLPACSGRLTQRWEASLWLAGKQMYLGGFVAEEDAARAYDLAALACKGLTVPTNFAASQYSQSLAEVSGSSRVRCMQLNICHAWTLSCSTSAEDGATQAFALVPSSVLACHRIRTGFTLQDARHSMLL